MNSQHAERVNRGPKAISADVRLLTETASRRLLAALWEMEGGTMPVMPAAAAQLPGSVRVVERQRWELLFDREMRRSGIGRDEKSLCKVVSAAGDAAANWMQRELQGEGSGRLAAAALNRAHGALARGIADRIPVDCFRPPQIANRRRNAEIIGQAAALGVPLIAGEVMGSIETDAANEWLASNGHAPSPLILTVPQAALALRPDVGRERLALQAALGASLPESDGGVEHDLPAVRAFIAQLAGGNAWELAIWAAQGLEDAEDLRLAFREARQRLPALARAAERERQGAVEAATAAAGYRYRP